MAAIRGATEQRAFGRRRATPRRSAAVELPSTPPPTLEYLPLKARILLTAIAGLGAMVATLVFFVVVLEASTEQPAPALFGPESKFDPSKMFAQERYHWAPIWAPPIASFILASLIAWPWLRNRPPLNFGRAMLLVTTLIYAAFIVTQVTRAIWPIAVMPGVGWYGLVGASGMLAIASGAEVISPAMASLHVIGPILLVLASILLVVTREWLETREVPVMPAHHTRRVEIIKFVILALTSIAMGKSLMMIAQVSEFRPIGLAHSAVLAVAGAIVWAVVSYPKAEFSLRRILMGAALLAIILSLFAFVFVGRAAPIPVDPFGRILGASLAVAWLGRQVRVPIVWLATKLSG